MEVSADLKQNSGINISDCIVQPTSNGVSILVNHLRMSQKIESGAEIGILMC